MHAEFFTKTETVRDAVTGEVKELSGDWVRISGLGTGRDVLERPVEPADRTKFVAEWKAFYAPAVTVEAPKKRKLFGK